jgi:DNA replication protein DnaC
VRAVECGFGVSFYRLEVLLAMLRRDADLSSSRMRRKKYLSSSLLVIDEVGFDPMTRQEAGLFFRVVSHRYQRGSILITTNKGIREWPEILAGDEVLATAILDPPLNTTRRRKSRGDSAWSELSPQTVEQRHLRVLAALKVVQIKLSPDYPSKRLRRRDKAGG